MHRLRQRRPHQPGRADGAIEPGVIAHLDDGRDAAPLLADQLREGALEFDFARGVRLVAELVFQPVDAHGIARAVRRPARHQEAGKPLGRLREHEEGVAHRRRHEPFVAVETECAVGGLGARHVGAQIRAALVFGHAHADERAALFARGRKTRVVAAREQARQPFRRDLGRLPQRRHRAVGHGDRAIDPALDLREHVSAGGARDMRAFLRLRPGAGMQPGFAGDRQHGVPGRMKLDLVDAVAEAVEALELRRIAVGGKAERDRVRLAEFAAEHAEFPVRPGRALALDRRAQHGVAGEQIIGLERRRLVRDLEHRHPSSFRRLLSYPSPERGGWRAKRAGWGRRAIVGCPHPAARCARVHPPPQAGEG